MLRYLKNLFQLIISPQSAWEDISAEMTATGTLSSRGLWPMTALAAILTVVQRVCYEQDADWGAALILILAAAAAYVCTYYIFGQILVDRMQTMAVSDSVSGQKGLTVVNYVLGLLCLVQIITEVIPYSIALSYLLPAGVSIVMWKAETYLGIRKDMTLSYYIWGVGCLILPPFLIQGFFKMII